MPLGGKTADPATDELPRGGNFGADLLLTRRDIIPRVEPSSAPDVPGFTGNRYPI
jgi:hypothetical protein